ncbi:MAG: hypothetical protein WCL02_01735 [bacterium]
MVLTCVEDHQTYWYPIYILIVTQKKKDKKKIYLRISLIIFLLIVIITYLVYGKISDARRKIIPEINAALLSLFSRVFLLPYSFPQAIHPIPSPSHPFGDISKTDPTNVIHARISTIINRVRIFYNNKNKCPSTIYIYFQNSTITKLLKFI